MPHISTTYTISNCDHCNAYPCQCGMQGISTELAPNELILAPPSLRALYAARAELAAHYAQDKSYEALVSHPPDYAAVQAQIREAEKAYATMWQQPGRGACESA